MSFIDASNSDIGFLDSIDDREDGGVRDVVKDSDDDVVGSNNVLQKIKNILIPVINTGFKNLENKIKNISASKWFDYYLFFHVFMVLPDTFYFLYYIIFKSITLFYNILIFSFINIFLIYFYHSIEKNNIKNICLFIFLLYIYTSYFFMNLYY